MRPLKVDTKKRDELDLLFGSPLDVVSKILRAFIIADEGKLLVGGDFSSIEARVLAWLAGETRVLNIFKSHGKIYEFAASSIYGVPIESVTKEQRQIGKVAVLALGYQGGKGAFLAMAKNYGVVVSEAKAEEIKIAWRKANPKIVRYWYNVESAAISACEQQGVSVSVGPPKREVVFLKKGSFLWVKLPSERVLCYPYPKIEEFETPWGEKKTGLTYVTENSLTRKWERTKTFGGSLVENFTQAVARDVMVHSMLRLDAAGYPIICTIHDEIISEVEKEKASEEAFGRIMSTPPKWASDLPIQVETFSGERYAK